MSNWQYVTIETVKRTYGLSGYWFTPDTMRGFNTRLSEEAYHNPATDEYLFISSEKENPWRYNLYPRRAYTIRRMYPLPPEMGGTRNNHGHAYTIDNVGEFGQFASLSGAKAAMQRYMKENPNGTPTVE